MTAKQPPDTPGRNAQGKLWRCSVSAGRQDSTSRHMTGTPLDLTVIISAYNTRSLLRNCLDSIYHYTKGITFEVICIDDNSSDGSADMVAERFSQVILLRNTVNQLYAKNQNRGMRMSRARYACLLDSDTVLTGNAFQALVQFMDEHPDAAACGPKLLNLDGSVQHCIRRFAGAGVFFLQAINWHKLFPASRVMNRYYATDTDYSKAQPVESIGTSAYVIRRSTWEQAGMLDEHFRLALVDLAYNYMLSRKGMKVYYTPCAEVVHLGSQSVNQNVLGSLRDQRDALMFFSETYDYFGRGAFTKLAVRLAVILRYYLKVLEYHLSSDKRLIKGPGAPGQEVAAQAALIRKSE
jgi:GT2 family glycosyltransferase